jgi:uncharacterized protein RhaS with RHS repeats
MFDPTIGRWTTEDPSGFEAADADLFRYVRNNPTNLTDPSGMAPILQLVDNGQPVSPIFFGGTLLGGAKVSVPGGPQGKIEVSLGAKYRTIDLQLRERVQNLTAGERAQLGLTREKLRDILEGISFEAAIAIRYVGTQAEKVQVVQLFWEEVWLKPKQGPEEFLDEPIPTTAGPVKPSTPKTGPYWHVDAQPDAANPTYGGDVIRTADSVTVLDSPEADRPLAILSRNLAKKNDQDYVGGRSAIHYDTYFVFKGKPIYRVSWIATSTWKKGQKPTNTEVRVAGGEANPSLRPGQKGAVNENERWDRQDVIDTRIPVDVIRIRPKDK